MRTLKTRLRYSFQQVVSFFVVVYAPFAHVVVERAEVNPQAVFFT